MATNSIDIDAHAEAVWSVIADPTTYPTWLVGTRRVLQVDPDFPARGSRFRHEVGVGPFRLRDHSTVLDSHLRSRCLVLQVRARPVIGAARVEMTVLTAGVGCARITMREQPRAMPFGPLLRPVAEHLIKARNARSLANLRGLLETPEAIREAPLADDVRRSAERSLVGAPVRRPRRRGVVGGTRAIA